MGERVEGTADVTGLQLLGHPPVDRGRARRTQEDEHGVLHQCVDEHEPAGRVGHLAHERGRSGVGQDVEQLRLLEPRHAAEKGQIELGADDRSRGQDVLRLHPQPGDAGRQDLPHAVGQQRRKAGAGGRGDVEGIQATCLVEVARHLGDEEGVAVRLRHQPLGQLLAPGTGPAGPLLQEGQDVVGPEPADGDAIDPLDPTQQRDHLAHRMIADQLVAAEGAHDEEVSGRLVGDEAAQQRRRRLVDPVEALQHHHDRRELAEAHQQVGDGREQQVALGLGIGSCRGGHVPEPGEQRRRQRTETGAVPSDVVGQQLTGRARDEMVEGLHERSIRGPHVLLAPADRDRGALPVPAAGRLHEHRRLAGPRFTTDERGPPAGATADGAERPVEPVELPRTPHERRLRIGEAGRQGHDRRHRDRRPGQLVDLDRVG